MGDYRLWNQTCTKSQQSEYRAEKNKAECVARQAQESHVTQAIRSVALPEWTLTIGQRVGSATNKVKL